MSTKKETQNDSKMSRKKKKFGAEYLFAALILIIAAVVVGWLLNRMVVVDSVKVYGNQFAGSDEIISLSGIREGMHGDSIVFLDVIERVEASPWIATAYVNLSQSGNMSIRVEEEKPMALLVDRGRTAWVTESGLVLPALLGQPVDVPILYGYPVSEELAAAARAGISNAREGTERAQSARWSESGRPDTLQSESFQIVTSFLTQAKKYPALYAMISEVMFTERDGVIALTDRNAVRLTFGHEDFDDRLRKWRTFQSQVISEKGTDYVRSLDFRFRGQVVARE